MSTHLVGKPKPDPHQASAFEKEQVLLIAFTNHWCTRCLLLRPEFEAAANLLYDADPAVALATM